MNQNTTWAIFFTWLASTVGACTCNQPGIFVAAVFATLIIVFGACYGFHD